MNLCKLSLPLYFVWVNTLSRSYNAGEILLWRCPCIGLLIRIATRARKMRLVLLDVYHTGTESMNVTRDATTNLFILHFVCCLKRVIIKPSQTKISIHVVQIHLQLFKDSIEDKANLLKYTKSELFLHRRFQPKRLKSICNLNRTIR